MIPARTIHPPETPEQRFLRASRHASGCVDSSASGGTNTCQTRTPLGGGGNADQRCPDQEGGCDGLWSSVGTKGFQKTLVSMAVWRSRSSTLALSPLSLPRSCLKPWTFYRYGRLCSRCVTPKAAKYSSDDETPLWPAVATNQLALPAPTTCPRNSNHHQRSASYGRRC